MMMMKTLMMQNKSRLLSSRYDGRERARSSSSSYSSFASSHRANGRRRGGGGRRMETAAVASRSSFIVHAGTVLVVLAETKGAKNVTSKTLMRTTMKKIERDINNNRARKRASSRPTRARASSSSEGGRTQEGDKANNESRAAKKVNLGLEKFAQKQYEEAAVAFTDALKMQPNEEESRASHYNRACAYVKMDKLDEAKDDLILALEKFDLDFRVLKRDEDLVKFRKTEQFVEIDDEYGDGKEKQSSRAKLRAEAAEPFRFLKLFLFGSLASGAAVGLVIILSRLVLALKGGGGGDSTAAEDVPDLVETVKNLGINSTALIVLGLLLKNELKGRDATLQQAEREEELGRLQVQLKKDENAVPLSRLRSLYRVFVVAGSESHVFETMANLEKFREKFVANKILVCTVTMLENDGKPTGDGDAMAMDLSFGSRSKRTKKSSSEFDSQILSFVDAKERWRIQAKDQAAWRRWIINQIEVDGFDPLVRDVFFAIAKNGTLWKSGAGVPNWMKLLEELPEDGSVQASVTGI